MKSFYKIVDGKAQVGNGVVIPDGFLEYTRGSESQELLAILAVEKFTSTLANKQSEITQAFNTSVAALTTALPHEMVSWRKQEDEARAWNADNSVITPFMDTQLVTRNLGETKQELVDKIIANSDAYTIKYAELLGKYQNLFSRLNTASELTDLENLNW